jgi:hypothetical protein
MTEGGFYPPGKASTLARIAYQETVEPAPIKGLKSGPDRCRYRLRGLDPPSTLPQTDLAPCEGLILSADRGRDTFRVLVPCTRATNPSEPPPSSSRRISPRWGSALEIARS